MFMVEELAFTAWSLLNLTSTVRAVQPYPDDPGARYVYDTTVPSSPAKSQDPGQNQSCYHA